MQMGNGDVPIRQGITHPKINSILRNNVDNRLSWKNWHKIYFFKTGQSS
jgi:hypothetical protein